MYTRVTLSLFVLILFFGMCTIQAQTTPYLNKKFTTDQSKSQFLRYLAEKHTSNGLAILNAETDIKDYTVYARGNTHSDMLSSFSTVIHESCHGFNFNIGIAKMKQVGYETRYQGYYISPSIKLAVPQGATYRSNQLNKVVPKNWQKDIFRYDTYIGDGSDVSSQINGIYGMIDEFDAYYQGTKANLELQRYYEAFCDYSDVDCWTSYLSESSSTLYAYDEFRLFIAWYLKYAKQKFPKVYQETMNNKPLRVAFSLVNQLFGNLQREYFERRDIIIQKLNATSDKRLVIEGEYLMVYAKDGMSASGIGAPDTTIQKLKKRLTPEDLSLLKQFAIAGITTANYKQYLN